MQHEHEINLWKYIRYVTMSGSNSSFDVVMYESLYINKHSLSGFSSLCFESGPCRWDGEGFLLCETDVSKGLGPSDVVGRDIFPDKAVPGSAPTNDGLLFSFDSRPASRDKDRLDLLSVTRLPSPSDKPTLLTFEPRRDASPVLWLTSTERKEVELAFESSPTAPERAKLCRRSSLVLPRRCSGSAESRLCRLDSLENPAIPESVPVDSLYGGGPKLVRGIGLIGSTR